MLEQHGNAILKIIGKQPAARGIILVSDMPAALERLKAAIESEQKLLDAHKNSEAISDEPGTRQELVTMRQRAAPFIDMLRRSMNEQKDIVWGV